jgi:hypothetical protein
MLVDVVAMLSGPVHKVLADELTQVLAKMSQAQCMQTASPRPLRLALLSARSVADLDALDIAAVAVNEPSLLESFVCTQPERAMSLLSQGPAIGLAVDKVAGRAIPAELVPHAFACVDWSAALRHRLLHGQSFAGACRTMRQLLAEMPSDAHPASVFDWLQALLSQPSARCMDLTEEETQAMAGLIVLEQAQEVGGACG